MFFKLKYTHYLFSHIEFMSLKKLKYKTLFFSLSAAILSAIAFTQMFYLLAFVSLVPLFYLFKNSPKKTIFLNGFVFGLIFGFCLCYWMINGIIFYTGVSYLYGLFFISLSAIGLGLYYGLVFTLCNLLFQQNLKTKKGFIINRLAIAALWCLLEYGLANILKGMPLHNFRIGFPLSKNIYTLQLASIGGISLFTFFIVLINLFIAEYFRQKNKIYVLYTLFTVSCVFSLGIILFYSYNPVYSNKPFKVVLVSENISSEVKWNKENGNELALRYFNHCKEAVSQNPDFIIWTENTLPWSYSKEDDLLNELFNLSKNTNITQVIGLNSEIEINSKRFYNSVFYLNNTSTPKSYNKNVLLKGVEEPLGEILLPFMYDEGFSFKSGNNLDPILTKFGNAANVICNEVIEESIIVEQANKKANFFFNLSNDSWFNDSYIALHHFYYARVMAVESRKDFVVNSNCGFSGIIKSTGEISSKIKDSKASLIKGIITPNDSTTLFVKSPQLLTFIFFIILIFNFLYNKNNY
jgi:apolipoprotein N-acyltransferase